MDLGGSLTDLKLFGAAAPILGDPDFVQPIGVGAHHKDDPPHRRQQPQTGTEAKPRKAIP